MPDNNWASSRQNLSSGFSTKRDSNQYVQLHRLARNFVCSKFRYYTFHKANHKGADQSARMRRLRLRLCCSQTPEDRFCRVEAQSWFNEDLHFRFTCSQYCRPFKQPYGILQVISVHQMSCETLPMSLKTNGIRFALYKAGDDPWDGLHPCRCVLFSIIDPMFWFLLRDKVGSSTILWWCERRGSTDCSCSSTRSAERTTFQRFDFFRGIVCKP